MYLNRGHGPPQSHTENLEGNCLPDSQCDKMQRLQGCLCRTFQSHLLAKKNCHHSNGIKLNNVQESAGSAVGDKYQTRLYSTGANKN